MKIRITAHIKDVTRGIANVHCTIEWSSYIKSLMPVVFVSFLKAMKDCDEDAFYAAMGQFANEDHDGAMKWMEEHLKNG